MAVLQATTETHLTIVETSLKNMGAMMRQLLQDCSIHIPLHSKPTTFNNYRVCTKKCRMTLRQKGRLKQDNPLKTITSLKNFIWQKKGLKNMLLLIFLTIKNRILVKKFRNYMAQLWKFPVSIPDFTDQEIYKYCLEQSKNVNSLEI